MSRYDGMSAEQIATDLARNGYTQEGVDALYTARGLGVAPRVPPELIGGKPGAGRDSIHIYGADGKLIHGGGSRSFLNNFYGQAIDPFRPTTVGNYLGMAGLLAGGAGALSSLGAGAAAGGAGGSGTGAGLGVFSNGGAAGLAGVGGGNAGALAASGGILGGAGIGGTIGGALGGLSGVANSISGVGGGAAGAGGSMGWFDTLLDAAPVIGSLYNSGQQRDAARDASRAEQAGIQAGIDENRRQFDTVLDLTKPQRELGYGAVNTLGRINSGDMSAFTTSPDYQFRRDEGTRDVNNDFAARGGALSGNALRGITDFNSNLASGEFNNFIQRRLQEAGLGGAATSQAATSAQYTGANVSNLLNQGGNARASGIIDSSNAVTGGINDLANWYGNWRKNRAVGVPGQGPGGVMNWGGG